MFRVFNHYNKRGCANYTAPFLFRKLDCKDNFTQINPHTVLPNGLNYTTIIIETIIKEV